MKVEEKHHMSSKKFTFKTERSTGSYKSFYGPTYHIKLNKIKVGLIGHEIPHTIRLRVLKNIDEAASNCNWKWVVLKRESTSVDDAKTWLNAHFEQIMNKWQFPKE
jgi:hypothetical protein